MRRRFTLFVLGGMLLGVLVGFLCHQYIPDAAQRTEVADYFNILTTVFLRLIKMIIAPLVFATLVVGVAHMEDAGSVGRVGAKTLGWFVCASIVSLTIGLVMVHLLQPGVGLALPHATGAGAASGVDASHFSLSEFVTHVFPTSIIDAMARNEILQIVVFAVFVGTAIAAIDNKAPQVLQLAEQATAVMLKVTGFVMLFAPVAIFAALASTITTQGLGILLTYAQFVCGFYLSLGVLWALLIGVLFIVARRRGLSLIAAVREPTLLAFSTASSEAAYPRTLEALQSWGISRRIASFVLPLGYSFNLDGSMMYCTFAVLFICQAYGIDLPIGQQLLMLGLLMVTSKGMAGVPRASLVVIAATLTYFRLPESGLLLILAVDHLLDMGRSATNVVGNTVAAAVVARWEGEITDPATRPPEPPLSPEATRAAASPEGAIAGTIGGGAADLG